MANKEIEKNLDNFKAYRDKIGDSFDQEMAIFERFTKEINRRASNHRQVSNNNLEAIKKSIQDLKIKVNKLKQSIFYHEETTIVERQKIIMDTEKQIHNQNEAVLEFEYKNAKEKVINFDYLNKALIQSAFDFFNEFKMYYSKDVLDLDELYEFLEGKNKAFESIIQLHEKQIFSDFNELDSEIQDMNTKIALLMQQKNTQLNKIYAFYQRETNDYLDNQLTFSAESDLDSDEIKDLVDDKLKQFERFRSHLLKQEKKVKAILHEEYIELYNKVLTKTLQRRGNLIIQDINFFNHPDESLSKLKEQIVFAKNENLGSLPTLIKTYNHAIKYEHIRKNCEHKARKMTKKFLKLKKVIFFEYQKESRKLINQMEKYYKLYIDLLKVDPFLAQIIGDNSTKIVKDEINYLSTLRINKEHKINVNYDIKTLKLNQQINEIEEQLVYEVEKEIQLQDLELLELVYDVQEYFIDKYTDTAVSKNHLEIVKQNIFKLEKAINAYLKYELSINNVNRKYLNLVTEIMIDYIRSTEGHKIDLVDALSDIRLALKEFQITKEHFQNLFDNEKRFLAIQSTRVDDETKITDEFILTAYENQMRFAKDQISFAEDELKLRVESIIKAIDEERQFYQEIIDKQDNLSKRHKHDILDEYSLKIYEINSKIQQTGDTKSIAKLNKELDKLKTKYDNVLEKSRIDNQDNPIIIDAINRLKTLDDHLEEALNEAIELRDETINEMTELYVSTKEKYDYLKNYNKFKIYPLEPQFYLSFERMKKRYEFKLKRAEVELDLKTDKLLDEYVKLYFEEQPELNKELIKKKITDLQSEKDYLLAVYQDDIAKIENENTEIIENLANKLSALKLSSEQSKSQIIERKQNDISAINNDLSLLENRHNHQKEKKKLSFDSEISNLTTEYNLTLQESKKYINNLSQAFSKVLDTYKPYLKLTKNNKKIRVILKRTDRLIKRKQKQELKQLAKKLRKQRLLLNK
jgi:hypothetical protein